VAFSRRTARTRNSHKKTSRENVVSNSTEEEKIVMKMTARNGSCPHHEWDHTPIFWVFNSPSPAPPWGWWIPQGRGHVGRHCPYTNKIWCGSVHALLRYPSKTAKMQKFPIDSHSNEHFISLFFRPAGVAKPQKGRRHTRNQSTPACKLWRESARGLSRNRWPNKKKQVRQ